MGTIAVTPTESLDAELEATGEPHEQIEPGWLFVGYTGSSMSWPAG